MLADENATQRHTHARTYTHIHTHRHTRAHRHTLHYCLPLQRCRLPHQINLPCRVASGLILLLLLLLLLLFILDLTSDATGWHAFSPMHLWFLLFLWLLLLSFLLLLLRLLWFALFKMGAGTGLNNLLGRHRLLATHLWHLRVVLRVRPQRWRDVTRPSINVDVVLNGTWAHGRHATRGFKRELLLLCLLLLWLLLLLLCLSLLCLLLLERCGCLDCVVHGISRGKRGALLPRDNGRWACIVRRVLHHSWHTIC